MVVRPFSGATAVDSDLCWYSISFKFMFWNFDLLLSVETAVTSAVETF